MDVHWGGGGRCRGEHQSAEAAIPAHLVPLRALGTKGPEMKDITLRRT